MLGTGTDCTEICCKNAVLMAINNQVACGMYAASGGKMWFGMLESQITPTDRFLPALLWAGEREARRLSPREWPNSKQDGPMSMMHIGTFAHNCRHFLQNWSTPDRYDVVVYNK